MQIYANTFVIYYKKKIGELKKEKQKKEKRKSHSYTSKVLLGGLVVEFG